MTPPLPIQIESATVKLDGSLVTVSAHELHIQHRLPKLMADAVWERLGVEPGTVTLELTAPTATVELERGGIRIRFGPLNTFRPVLHAYWRFLHSRELAEKGVAHVA